MMPAGVINHKKKSDFDFPQDVTSMMPKVVVLAWLLLIGQRALIMDPEQMR